MSATLLSSCPASWGSVRPSPAPSLAEHSLGWQNPSSLPGPLLFPSSLPPCCLNLPHRPSATSAPNQAPQTPAPVPSVPSHLLLTLPPAAPLTWPLAFGLCCFGLLSRRLSWVGTARKQPFSCSDVALEESQTSRELKASPGGGSEERAAGLVAVLERLRLVDFHERQGRSWEVAVSLLGWTVKGPSVFPEVTPDLSGSPSNFTWSLWRWQATRAPAQPCSSFSLCPHLLSCWVLLSSFPHLPPCLSFLPFLSPLHLSFLLHHLAQISSLSLPSLLTNHPSCFGYG